MQILNIVKRQTEKLLTAAGLGKKELSTRQYPPLKYSKFRTYPSQGLTPEKLGSIFKSADYGDVTRQIELFIEMEEKDAHLAGVLQTRKLAITKNDWEIRPFSDDSSDIEVAEFVEDALSGIQYTTDGFSYESLESGFLALLDAIVKGFAAVEIVWETGAQFRIKELIYLEPQNFNFYKDWPRPRIITDKALVIGEEIPLNKIIFHRHSARSGFTPRAALMRPLSWLYVFKNFSIKDWLRFSEAYGMPLRLGKVPNLEDKNAFDAMKTALQELGSDASGIIGQDAEIEFIEAEKRASVDIYKAFVEFCERGQSKAVLGQTLTTEVGDKGSYAASKTHGEVRQDILEADCEQLSNTLRLQLIKPLVIFNFGAAFADRLPWFKFKYEPAEDLNAQATRDKTLVEIGVPIGVSYFRTKYNLPEPEKGEEIVVPPGRVPIAPGFTTPDHSFALPRTASERSEESHKKKHPALQECRARSLTYARPPLASGT